MFNQEVDEIVCGDRGSSVDELIPAVSVQQRLEPARGPFVGECEDADHPTLAGRVRVLWQDSRGLCCRTWLPCVHSLTVRKGDRVLVEQPSNWPEPIVVGVIDGFAMRPASQLLPGPTVTLKKDESVCVDSRDGQRLIEIYQGDDGPVVRLLTDDVNLEIPGRFRVNAHSVDLGAARGEVRIVAHDDVVVEGKTVKLN